MSNECVLENVAKEICNDNDLKFIRFIASGNFKETFQVENQIGKFLALKVFKANNSSERTNREIDAMRRVNSVNVAKLFKVDVFKSTEGEFLYIFEEYLAGGSLADRIKRDGLIGKAEIILIGNGLINALESTYNENIVHRDIKPDNIMFRNTDSEAVLVDFGLVRDLKATSLTQTFYSMGPGTPFYSSPEQLNNNRNLIDWRSDQFSLGITLCECLFGSHPFDVGSVVNTIERVASLGNCNENVKKDLMDLGLEPILKMLQSYPINRFRTPNQLKSDWSKLEA